MSREAALGGVVADLIVEGRAADARRAEAHPELDALDRLQAHQRVADPAVELAIPLHVAAESDRQARRHDLDDAAERVAGFLALVDRRDYRALGGRVANAY